jgi:hypothetical protein
VAVRLALVEEAGDRFLSDVAALREADGALVESRLLRDDGVVEVDAVARAPALDAQHLGGRLVDLGRACLDQRRLHALGVGAVANDVDADIGADQQHLRAADLAAHVVVLLRIRGQTFRSQGAWPDQGEQAAFDGAFVQLAVEPDLVAADRVEEGLQRAALAQQEQLHAGVDHAQVGEHLALVGEQRGVAALPGLERLDLVGHLAVEERLRLGAGQRELAALGAVDERHALSHGCVGVHRATS